MNNFVILKTSSEIGFEESTTGLSQLEEKSKKQNTSCRRQYHYCNYTNEESE